MKLARARRRLVDLAVTLVAVACCAAPLLSISQAAQIQVPITVGQNVGEAAHISQPTTDQFEIARDSKSRGQLSWDVYSTANQGFKLAVTTDSTPALQVGGSRETVSDFSRTVKAWSVPAGQRNFGFSVEGADALGGFSQGSRWRGFDGARSIEIAQRRKGPVPVSRTTMHLLSEMRAPLSSRATPHVFVMGTAMVNL